MTIDKLLSQPAYQRHQSASIPTLEEFVSSLGGEVESICVDGKDVPYEEFKNSARSIFSEISVTENLKQQLQELKQKGQVMKKRDIVKVLSYGSVSIAIANDDTVWILQGIDTKYWVKMESEAEIPELPQD